MRENMMARHIQYPTAILMGLGILVALSGSLRAEESTSTEPSRPVVTPHEAAKAAQPKEMLGRIMAVERERGVLTIAQDIPLAPDATTELVVNDQTLIARGSQRLGLEDVRPGEEYVRIRYLVVDDRPVVLAITFEPLPNLQRMSGTSQAIDFVRGELVVKPRGLFGGDPKHFTVKETTVITREGLRSYLTHLLIGDAVVVDYTTDGETLTAHFVTVKPSKSGHGWFSGLGGARQPTRSQQSSGLGPRAPATQ